MVRFRGTIEPYGAVSPSGTELADGEVLRRRADSSSVEGYIPAAEGRAVKHLDYELWIVAAQSNWEGMSDVEGCDEEGLDAGHPRAWQVTRPSGDITNSAYAKYYLLPTVGASEDVGSLIPLHGVTLNSRNESLTPSLSFARRRLQMYPAIKGLAILDCARGGSGFTVVDTSLRWGESATLHEEAIGEAEDFLEKHPQYAFAGLLTDLPASEVASTTTATTSTNLQDFCDDFRDSLRGGDRAVFVVTEIPKARREAAEVHADSALAQIDAVSELDRAGLVRVDDLSLADPIHFDQQGLRDLGARVAEVAASVADFTPRRAAQPYRMQYDATLGRFADKFGSDARIFDEVTVDDVTLQDSSTGTVLHCDREGFNTSMRFPLGSEYTIALWCSRKVSQTGNNPNAGGGSGNDTDDFYVCGKLTGQTLGNSFARRSVAHVEAGTATPNAVDIAGVGEVNDVDGWFHAGVVFKDGTLQRYVDGAVEGSASGGGTYPDATGAHIVQIGCRGDTTGVDGIPDMYFDDIVILPYALTTAQMLALADDGVLPS